MSEIKDTGRTGMQCLEFRRAVGAEPAAASAAVLAHAAGCRPCAEYRRQMQALDGQIRRALEIPVPARAGSSAAAGGATSPRSTRWLALAASLVLAAGIGFGLWATAPRESLAVTVVEHLDHEPDAMVTTEGRVTPFALEDVLAKGGIRLRSGLEGVSYAKSCPIRGYSVPHLVVQTDYGPVTVLVMAHEHVTEAVPLREAGLAGTIVPAGPGSIAIIGGESAPIDEVRKQVLDAVEFLGSDP
jgi:hypothetical protein